MKDIKDIIKFIIGFLPWILFLFISGHTLVSLEHAIIICLLASILTGYSALRKRFILQWGTLAFFVICAVVVNLMENMFVIKHMGIFSNGFLAAIVWFTVLTGKPFTLQYAREEIPEEKWNEPSLIKGCNFMAVVWGCLMTFSMLVAVFKAFNPGMFPEKTYFDVSLTTIAVGIIFTQLYKNIKRKRTAN
ncbi:MAG: hypothetical protein P9L90_06265 [Candidatus Aadella gelida]|nr:hypothetical protein [Candidatus Aadella gelida]